MYAEIFYGCIKVYENPDEPTQDMLTELVDEHSKNGCALTIKPGTWTLRFGIPITTVSEHDTKFDMREVLAVIEPTKLALRPDLQEHWQRIMPEIPYKLREELSRPEFYVAWGA